MEGRVPSDGEQLNSLLDSVSAAIFNACDAYGWGVPAILLSILFLALVVLFVSMFEDLPGECIEGIPHLPLVAGAVAQGASHNFGSEEMEELFELVVPLIEAIVGICVGDSRKCARDVARMLAGKPVANRRLDRDVC